jgi:hypothetical protein
MKLTVFLRQVAEGGIARRVYPLGAIRRVLIGTGERIWDWLKLVWWEKYGFEKNLVRRQLPIIFVYLSMSLYNDFIIS